SPARRRGPVRARAAGHADAARRGPSELRDRPRGALRHHHPQLPEPRAAVAPPWRRRMTDRVTHVTTYRYEEPASGCHNALRLSRRSGGRQRTRRTQLGVDPPPSVLVPHVDFFGNQVHFVALHEPHRQLTVTAKSDVDVAAAEPPGATPPWEAVRDRLRIDRD